MREFIEEYLDGHIKSNNITLTEAQYQDAYNGVEFALKAILPDAVSDSITSVK